MALESAIFMQKSHKFSDTNPSNFIIYNYKHFKQLFLYKTKKKTNISLSRRFQLYFTFNEIFFPLALSILHPDLVLKYSEEVFSVVE